MESKSRDRIFCGPSLCVKNIVIRCLLIPFGFASALSGCEGDRLGELQLKPIYADLSSSYYGGMCEGEAGPGTSAGSVRALRISTVAGNCAVLYLDGLDRAGEIVIYGSSNGDPPECSGLIQKLEVGRASPAVVARAREMCK